MTMQCDYYAFRQSQLSGSLSKIEQAAGKLEQAKALRDREGRKQSEDEIMQAAKVAAQIEAHQAYLWFEANHSELDNSIRDAWQKTLTARSIPEVFRTVPKATTIAQMPPLSFLVSIPFRLQRPYLSR